MSVVIIATAHDVIFRVLVFDWLNGREGGAEVVVVNFVVVWGRKQDIVVDVFVVWCFA